MDLADTMDLSGMEQEPLRNRSLTGVDVSDDADVAHHIDLGHGELSYITAR